MTWLDPCYRQWVLVEDEGVVGESAGVREPSEEPASTAQEGNIRADVWKEGFKISQGIRWLTECGR